MPVDYSFTAADAGSHAFFLTLITVGSQNLTASDIANPALTGSVTGIDVLPPTNPAPPVITISAAANPNPAKARSLVNFSVAASDPTGLNLTYNWSFGDHSSGTGSTVSHKYLWPGSYMAIATVSNGVSASTSSVAVM